MPDRDFNDLHRDLSDIKSILARLEERLNSHTDDTGRMRDAQSVIAKEMDLLRSRMDRAEGAVSVWRWIAGAGAGAGGGSILIEIIQLASQA